jgi:hypothetical protein
MEVQRIKEDAEYEDVRIRFNATPAKAEMPKSNKDQHATTASAR